MTPVIGSAMAEPRTKTGAARRARDIARSDTSARGTARTARAGARAATLRLAKPQAERIAYIDMARGLFLARLVVAIPGPRNRVVDLRNLAPDRALSPDLSGAHPRARRRPVRGPCRHDRRRRDAVHGGGMECPRRRGRESGPPPRPRPAVRQWARRVPRRADRLLGRTRLPRRKIVAAPARSLRHPDVPGHRCLLRRGGASDECGTRGRRPAAHADRRRFESLLAHHGAGS